MCGIIGVSAMPDAARIAYLGLYALQHRGQESAGIVALDRDGLARTPPRHGTGLRTFNESMLAQLPGDVAVGHTRYSHHRQHRARQRAALHRRRPLRPSRPRPQRQPHQCRRDQARAGGAGRHLHQLVGHRSAGAPDRPLAKPTPWKARSATRWNRWMAPTAWSSPSAARSTPRSTAAGSARSCSGRLGGGMVVASETCALDLLGATLACELQPGEFIRIDDGEVTELPRPARAR